MVAGGAANGRAGLLRAAYCSYMPVVSLIIVGVANDLEEVALHQICPGSGAFGMCDPWM